MSAISLASTQRPRSVLILHCSGFSKQASVTHKKASHQVRLVSVQISHAVHGMQCTPALIGPVVTNFLGGLLPGQQNQMQSLEPVQRSEHSPFIPILQRGALPARYQKRPHNSSLGVFSLLLHHRLISELTHLCAPPDTPDYER